MTRETAAYYIDGTVRDVDDLRASGDITPYGNQKRIKFKKTELDAVIDRMPEKARS